MSLENSFRCFIQTLKRVKFMSLSSSYIDNITINIARKCLQVSLDDNIIYPVILNHGIFSS